MRFLRSRYLGLFLLGCVLAALGWSAQAYVDLVRLEASVVDTRARVETASRIRLGLVENLLLDTRRGGGAHALEQVDRAAERVREAGLLPAAVEDEEGPGGFREVQGDLSAALNAVWKGQDLSANPSVEVAISDLKPAIQRWSAVLEQGLEELERQLEAFRASATGFPGSLIASIPRREGPADEGADTVTTRAEISASTAGAVR